MILVWNIEMHQLRSSGQCRVTNYSTTIINIQLLYPQMHIVQARSSGNGIGTAENGTHVFFRISLIFMTFIDY